MATSFINFSTKHAVAESTNLKATTVGNIWNIKAAADIDNGCIVKRGDYIAPEYYAEATATTFAGVIIEQANNGNFRVLVTAIGELEGLVLSVPLIYENFTSRMADEVNFYNAKDDLMRVYELYVGDVFTVSAEAFTSTPMVGGIVSVSNKKLAVTDPNALVNGTTTVVDLAGTDLTYTYNGTAWSLTSGSFSAAGEGYAYAVTGDSSANITDAASLLAYVTAKITDKTKATAGIAITKESAN